MTRTAILIAMAAFAATAATAKKPYDGRGTGPTIANAPIGEWAQCDPKRCSSKAMTPIAKAKEGDWLTLPFPPGGFVGKPPSPKAIALAASQRLLPPLEYDRPYTGGLVVMKLESNEDVLLICPQVTKVPVKACAQHTLVKRKDGSWTHCTIYMPVDSVIISAGYKPDTIYRHELGHCNGWGDDHKGARVAS